MKHVYKQATRSLVPDAIANRKDKMGFPVPLQEWMRGPARDFVTDVFASEPRPRARPVRQPAAFSPAWSARTASAARPGACSASSCGSAPSTTASTHSKIC